jgi:pimeloyl-ACP methyl ester carboxylesterase
MPRVSQIRVPTLAVCGAEDRLTPVKYHRFLEAQIPGCRLTIIEQAGHWVFWEQPEAFTRAVPAFLDELPDRVRRRDAGRLSGGRSGPGDRALACGPA